MSIEGVCPVPIVQDWKLYTMAQKVFHTIFDDREKTIWEAEAQWSKSNKYAELEVRIYI